MPIIGDNLEQIKKAFKLCGYYLSSPNERDIIYNNYNLLQFEPEFKKDVSKELRETEHILYHLTPHYNLKKIKHIGFSPRCKNEMFNYPSRIYFIKGSVKYEDIIKIGKELKNNNTSIGNTGEYDLITVDLSMIPKNIKIYSDTNYPYGVFVTDNLKPDIIKDVKCIELE